MDKEKFWNYIKNPGEVAFNPDMDLLNQIRSDYPYFQSAHLLLTIAYHQSNSIFFDKTLKSCALYAPDRTVLYNLVNHPYKLSLKESSNKKEENQELKQLNELIQSSAPAISADQLLSEIQNKNQDPEEGKEESGDLKEGNDVTSSTKEKSGSKEAKPSSYSFVDWLKHLKKQREIKSSQEKKEEKAPSGTMDSTRKSSSENQNKKTQEGKSGKKQAESDILNQFLENEPQLSRPKSEFYDPSDKAQKSIMEDEDLVSETLARIYFEQGHYKRAKEIYEKLSLLYPNKFDYFAEKIKEVKAKANKRK